MDQQVFPCLKIYERDKKNNKVYTNQGSILLRGARILLRGQRVHCICDEFCGYSGRVGRNEVPGALQGMYQLQWGEHDPGRTKVMESIFKYEEECYLGCHSSPSWKGNMPCCQAKGLRKRVKEPNLLQSSAYQRMKGGKQIRTAGSSIVKWEKRTSRVHSHCSCGVGTLAWKWLSNHFDTAKRQRLTGWSFHFLKYGTASMIIHGTHLPKYTTCTSDNVMSGSLQNKRLMTYLMHDKTHESRCDGGIPYP